MKSFKCPQCSLTNWTTAEACKRCGLVFQAAEAHGAPSDFGGGTYNNHNQPPFQQYGGNYQSPNYQYGQGANLKSGLAIASMVLGILGFVTAMFMVGILIAPIALILGIVALVKANKKPHVYGGKGFAIAGIVLGAMISMSFPIILAIAIPNLLAARRAANEGSAISSLRTLAGAEGTLMGVDRTGNCGDLRTLGARQLIDPTLANGEKSGYRFTIVNLPVIGGGCEIHATPLTSTGISSTGIRSFYFSTEDQIIRAADKKGKTADRSDPPIK